MSEEREWKRRFHALRRHGIEIVREPHKVCSIILFICNKNLDMRCAVKFTIKVKSSVTVTQNIYRFDLEHYSMQRWTWDGNTGESFAIGLRKIWNYRQLRANPRKIIQFHYLFKCGISCNCT
jgi:hypothetical protein